MYFIILALPIKLLALMKYLSMVVMFLSLVNMTAQASTFSEYFTDDNFYNLGKLARTLDDKTDTLLGQSIRYIMADSLEFAQPLIKQVIEEAEQPAMGYLLRSMIHAFEDEPGYARADLKKVIELEPRYIFAYDLLADAWWNAEQPDSARAALSKAMEIDPGSPLPDYSLGIIEAKEGHPTKARKMWQASIAKDSCYAPARIGMIVYRLLYSQEKRSMKEIEQVITCPDPHPDVYYIKSFLEWRDNKYDEALKSIGRALMDDE